MQRPIKFFMISMVVGTFAVLSYILITYVGIYAIPDSFLYANLGRFLHTGQWISVYPFNGYPISTLFGPVYGLLMYPLLHMYDTPAWPQGVTLFQLLMLGSSTVMIGSIAKKTIGSVWGIPVSCIFIFLPFSLIYTTYFMSEITAQFFITISLLLTFLYLQKQFITFLSLLVMMLCILTLTRYAYGLLLPPACLLWAHQSWQNWHKSIHVHSHSFQRLLPHIFALIGFTMIGWWISFNYHYYHVLTASTVNGRHLYDNVVTLDKLLPLKGDPSLIPFLFHLKNLSQLYQPWWEMQLIFHDDPSEVHVDSIFAAVSFAAIRAHPFLYLLGIIKNAFLIPATIPYYPKIDAIALSHCDASACMLCMRTPYPPGCWNSTMCMAPKKSCAVQKAWSLFIFDSELLYPIATTILFIFALIGCIFAIIKGSMFLRVTAWVFIAMHLFQSATEWTEGRFLIPLYPLYALLLGYGIAITLRYFRHVTSSHKGLNH